MASSLVKYHGDRGPDGEDLHWGRLDDDGVPFMGTPPLYRTAEAEQYLVRTLYFRNGRFDLSDPEQNKAYLGVMDRCANGRFVLRRSIDLVASPDQHVVYVEWLEQYMRDGGPARGQYGFTGTPPR